MAKLDPGRQIKPGKGHAAIQFHADKRRTHGEAAVMSVYQR
jgi:hypothetical protein